MACGCASAPKPAVVWISNHGGVLPARDLRQARVDAVCQKLIAACTGRRITVQVLATNVVTAYSLWDGHVFVTRGLVDRVNDAELQAAIAHELGHLLSDGRLRTVASLRGCCIDPDREVRADAAGVALLHSQGLSSTAMISLLRKVQKYGSLPPSCQLAVERRISLLAAASNSPLAALHGCSSKE